MKRLLNKEQVLTIPNLLSILRLALVPIIVYLYVGRHSYYTAIILVALSGITDIIDGQIARRFNMVSDFGKIIDPVADKFTQGSLILCLIIKYKLMILLIAIFVIKEGMMFFWGYLTLKRTDVVNSAKWYGKLSTAVLLSVLLLLLIHPTMSITVANILILSAAAAMILSLILYARFYFYVLRDNKK